MAETEDLEVHFMIPASPKLLAGEVVAEAAGRVDRFIFKDLR
jgi:hypothetical protein